MPKAHVRRTIDLVEELDADVQLDVPVAFEADTGVADASFEARWQSVMASLGRDEEPLP